MNHQMPQEQEPVAEAEVPQDGGAMRWVEEQVRNTPWWLMSIAFHLIVLAAMTVVTFKEELRVTEVPKIIPIRRTDDKVELTRPDDMFKSTRENYSTADMQDKINDNDEPVLIDYVDAIDGDHNESKNDDLPDNHSMHGQSKDFLSAMEGTAGGLKGRGLGGPGTNDVMGIGGGGGEAGRYGDPSWSGRVNMRKVDRGGRPSGPTKSTENAVTWGLRWLARHQSADGHWSAAGFDQCCSSGKCTDAGYSDYDSGLTGLSLLAFLGAGYTHLSKDTYVDPHTKKTICFGTVVKNGLKWLIANQDAEGCFGGRGGQKYMYNHSIAALAMTEAYGLTAAPVFKDAAQKGIDFLAAAQNPYKAWRYQKLCNQNDTSVTGWCVMALKSADLAKLNVSRNCYEGAKAWIIEVTDEAYYKVGYDAKGTGKVVVPGKNEEWDGHEALTAVGMLCRIFIDKDAKDPALEGGAKLLVADLPQCSGKKIDYYYWYYGSMALFQLDGPNGKYWAGWNEAMKTALLPSQKLRKDGCSEGSWDANVDRWGFEGGRVYSTAINVLTLEVYYRYASVIGGHRGK